MNSVNGIDAGNVTNATRDSNRTSVIGQDAFFKMLIAQLKNQDPTNPQGGTEFAVQLAQFASLERLTNLNATLTSQNQNVMNLISAQSVNLIGKEVTARMFDGKTESTINGQVTAVNFKDSAISLTVNGQNIPFSDVLSVK